MFLDKIVDVKHKEVEQLAANFELADYERKIANMPACLGFEKRLVSGSKRKLGLIAEVKKASPSKGLIRDDFDPVQLAKTYESAGADCISVLTDVDFFQGSNAYLTQIRQQVDVPLLRKDFIIDYRQVYEARVIGADAVLLIAAILTPAQLNEYYDLAKSLGMDVLVEVHDREELDTVLSLDKATLIGINNRDLRSFVTDIRTTEQLMAFIPEGTTVISESGISAPQEIAYLESVGARGVLIGEHFMRQADVGAAVIDLLGPIGK
ncbi:indole-3-glycerol phosphate synthase TrpC [Paenibacillaceae bacterium]|nr:indole-3-glycerol phosphate synthase TrpC [Paenibacillaceae bacterium]